MLRDQSVRETLYANLGVDRLYGAQGNDILRTVGDTQRDYVNCGPGFDRAYVSGDDVIDEVKANTLITTTALSCEVVFVDGVLVSRV